MLKQEPHSGAKPHAALAVSDSACYPTYPPASHFAASFGYRDYLQAVAGLRTRGRARPLALSLHIPFGDDGSGAQACPGPAARSRVHAGVYLGYLRREIDLQAGLFADMSEVRELRVAGGSPACLGSAQMDELVRHMRRRFRFAADSEGDYTICAGPGRVAPERVQEWRSQRFNCLRLAVQGGTPAADQRLAATIAAARAVHYRSVTVALAGAQAATLADVVLAGADRITVDDDALLWMPGPARQAWSDAGYLHAGAGLLARRGDALASAALHGKLHRNLHGYTALPDMELVGCGLAATSAVAATYSQNARSLPAYYGLIDRGELPIARGVALSMDDALRRNVIDLLLCQFELPLPAIEQAYPLSFETYFQPELAELGSRGLARVDGDWLATSAAGKARIIEVCSVFDRYAR